MDLFTPGLAAFASGAQQAGGVLAGKALVVEHYRQGRLFTQGFGQLFGVASLRTGLAIAVQGVAHHDDLRAVLLRDSGDLGGIDGARRVAQRGEGPRQQAGLV